MLVLVLVRRPPCHQIRACLCHQIRGRRCIPACARHPGIGSSKVQGKRRKKGVGERESRQVPLVMKEKKIDADVWVPFL